MLLSQFKFLSALLIFIISLIAGYASITLASKHTKYRSVGNAMANGIFIGASIFHLFPNAIHSFGAIGIIKDYTYTMILIVGSYATLLLINKFLSSVSGTMSKPVSAWLLTITLSIHAFIAGVALGISQTFALASVVFFAIIAHKAFETFALVVNLQRRLNHRLSVILVTLIFILITPFAIIFSTTLTIGLNSHIDSILTACFNAVAAGTFLYIGTTHAEFKPKHLSFDSYHRYTQILATLAGVALMAIVAIWV